MPKSKKAEPPMEVLVEDAQLLFRNFSGAATPMNAEGQRNFCVVLDRDTAKAMEADGWNVKYLPSREEEDEETPFIKIKVAFKGKPPKITLITSNSRTMLGQDLVSLLDAADIAKCDLIFNSYAWTMESTGKSGITAYLKTMFVTINEDDLERKYAMQEEG